MCYTYVMRGELARLDDLLVAVTRLYRSPALRRALMREVPGVASVAHLRILRAVEMREAAEEGPTIGAIANDLDVEHSTASREVSAVVHRGLLSKTSSATDQRRTCLALTDEGRRVLTSATAARVRWLEESTGTWARADLVELTVLLDRLLNDFAMPGEAERG